MMDFPYFVQLQRFLPIPQKFVTFCGGTIIDTLWVMTAASCLATIETNGSVQKDDIRVLVGTMKLNDDDINVVIHTIAETIPHHAYDGSTSQNDIALLRVCIIFKKVGKHC